MKSYVYCITNVLNGKQYVGKSIDPHRRWYAHQCIAQHDVPYKLYRAMQKHGIESFSFEIVSEHDSEDEAFEAEHELIVERNTCERGYNMNEGGEGGYQPCEETREKRSSSMKGKMHSEETRKKISATRIARHIPSPHKSEEGRQRIRERHLGVKRDHSVGEKISKRAIERRQAGMKRWELTAEQVSCIKFLLLDNDYKEIAKLFHVNPSRIWQIFSGKNWKNVSPCTKDDVERILASSSTRE